MHRSASVIMVLPMLIIFAIFASYFRLWIQSFLTGAGITIWELVGMTFRKVNSAMILLLVITAELTFRKVMPTRSQIVIPAPVKNDWIHSRK